MKLNLSEKEVKVLIEILDVNSDGRVSYTELKKIIASLSGNNVEEGEAVNMVVLKKKVQNTVYSCIQNNITLSDSLKHYDRRGKGEIFERDFIEALKASGFVLTTAEMKEICAMFKSITKIQYKKFLTWATPEVVTPAQAEKRIQQVVTDAEIKYDRLDFNSVTTGSSGLISKIQFSSALRKLRLEFTQYELRAIMKLYDRDGEVDYVKFVAFASKFVTTKKVDTPLAKLVEDKQVNDELVERWRELIIKTINSGIDYRNMFEQLDPDNRGVLSQADLEVCIRMCFCM
jgi:Ca2+-binding EF-hand superfamily protein